MATEDRAAPRAPLDARATVFVGSEKLGCRLLNASTTGLALVGAFPEPRAAFVRVQLSLPGGVGPIDADAILVRQRATETEVEWGVKFLDPTPEVTERLDELVRRALSPEPERDAAPERASKSPEASYDRSAEHEARERLRKRRLRELFKKAIDDLDS